MIKLSKSHFKAVIESLRDQYDYDISKAKLADNLLNVDDIPTYDNAKLTESIFRLLHLFFPPDKNGCEIKRFCYELNFGRLFSEESKENQIDCLWDYLNSQNPENIEVYFEEVKKKKNIRYIIKDK